MLPTHVSSDIPASARDEQTSVPISALEHYGYCPRQAALIHVEGYFASNVDTVRGDLAHEAVNRAGGGSDRRGQRVWHSLPVFSESLGIHGLCDAVEFGDDGPVPIEHKSGRYVRGGPADLQVGAQALCLEEMFGSSVPMGIVFAGRDRRRHDVPVGDELRRLVREAMLGVRDVIDAHRVPPPVADRRCRRCSLREGCLPDGVSPDVASSLFVPRDEGDWHG